MAPALSYFPDGKVERVFDSVMSEFAAAISANRTVFFKQDVDEVQVKHDLETALPGFLNCFYYDALFYCGEAFAFVADQHPGPEEFPLTEANADILNEYYVATEDLNALRQVAEEKVTADILGYFASPRRENDERMVKVFFNLHNMLRTFLSNSLRMLQEEWIMPELRKWINSFSADKFGSCCRLVL